MTQDEIIRMARELVTRHGSRMCDEDGETHGEELYCVGIEDVAEIIKQVATHEREACAKVCEQGTGDAVQTETLKLLLQERWRIASVIRGLK